MDCGHSSVYVEIRYDNVSLQWELRENNKNDRNVHLKSSGKGLADFLMTMDWNRMRFVRNGTDFMVIFRE